MSETWLPFHYRDFYDVPRAVLVLRDGDWYFLDSPFIDAVDEYSDKYSVYKLPAGVNNPANDSDWSALTGAGDLIGAVPVNRVRFDETRRRFISDNLFEMLGQVRDPSGRE